MTTHSFKPGDRVRGKHSGAAYTVLGTETRYLVRHENGAETNVPLDSLEPIPPADPREAVVRKVLHDWLGTHWVNPDVDSKRWPIDKAKLTGHILAALDAHSEDAEIDRDFRERALSAVQPRRVRDRDGDVWERQESGVYQTRPGGAVATYNFIETHHGPLEEI